MNVNIEQLKGLLIDVFKAKLVPSVTSSPGIGKSAIYREIAEQNKLYPVDIRLFTKDPAELSGFLSKDTDRNKAVYIPTDLFPLENDPIPEGYKGWLVVLDEFTSALPAMQAASYGILLDRMVGYHRIHSKAVLGTAGNNITDRAVAYTMSTAAQSRLIHFHLVSDLNCWIRWADANDIDFRIKSFLQFKPELLNNFKPDHNEDTFPCERTWHFLSNLIKNYEVLPSEKLPLLAGAIGEGAGREFFGYTQIFQHIPKIEQIKRNPDSISIPDDPSIQYALTGLISYHLSEKNIEQLIKFLVRLNIDFQVIALRSAIARNRDLKATKTIQFWIRENAREMAAFA